MRDDLEYFKAAFAEAAVSLNRVDDAYLRDVSAGAGLLIDAFESGRKVFVFGNGGSAADAQHIAAELVGRFSQDRAPLSVIALNTNLALLTAWSNDKGYDDALARELTAFGQPGDVAWGISTSGNSRNVLDALQTARSLGLRTLGLTGASGGGMRPHCDVLIAAPATDTPRIQELHVVTYHSICAVIERRLFSARRGGPAER